MLHLNLKIMKKIYSIIVVLFIALAVSAQYKVAQKPHTQKIITNQEISSYTVTTNNTKDDVATIVLTAGDVWGDGTGYQILIDAEATETDAWDGNPITCGSSYDAWEHMIPTNASSDDANVVMNASQQITIPAGTYDYAILNPGCTSFSTIYTASDQCDPSVGNDYVFEAGKIYTFTATLSGSNDCITLVVTDMPTEAEITANPTELVFVGIIGETTDARTSIITAFNLTEDITATTAAPFAVSADGITFGTTATIPQAGGTLYVNYTPTMTTPENGTVSLTSSSVSEEITLAGQGADCATEITLPYTQNFEDLSSLCWTGIQGSSSPTNALGIISDTSHVTGSLSWLFSSYNTCDIYDQYLISPELPVGTTDLNVEFFYMDIAEQGGEVFKVGYSSTTNDIAEFTWGDEITTLDNQDWYTYSGTVPAGTKFVGIYYYTDYGYYLVIDDITIQASTSIKSNVNSNISVFPNPANNVITVTNAENSNIVVLNMVGEVVASIENASANQTIDISNLASGSYFVRVNSEVFKVNVVK